MKKSMLCTTYMYLSYPPKKIIDINFQAVNLKKDKKKLFLISTTILFLEMLVLSYQRYAHGVSYIYKEKPFLRFYKSILFIKSLKKKKLEWLIQRQCHIM